MYHVVKTYGHENGFSAVFRQWRATHSHCQYLHGYALAFRFVFESEDLDENNWVIDFGNLKEIKEWLKSVFDHKLIVAEDDPEKDEICALAGLGIADVLVIPSTGCEGFAKFVYDHTCEWLMSIGRPNAPRLASVTVSEHGANSACYEARNEIPPMRTVHARAEFNDSIPY